MLILEITAGIVFAALLLRYWPDIWDVVRHIAGIVGALLLTISLAAGAGWLIIQTGTHWREALLDVAVFGVSAFAAVLIVAITRGVARLIGHHGTSRAGTTPPNATDSERVYVALRHVPGASRRSDASNQLR